MAGFTLVPRRRRDIKQLAYGPTGRLLASLGTDLDDVDLTWWDAELADELRTVPGGRGKPITLQFDGSGARLLVACTELRVFSSHTGFETHRITRAPSDGAVTGAAISPDGTLVASSGAGAIVIHRLEANLEGVPLPGRTADSLRARAFERAQLANPLDAPTGALTNPELLRIPLAASPGTLLAFSADGARLAAQLHDAVNVWDAATGALLHSAPIREPRALGLGPSRQLCVLVARGQTLVRCDLESATEHVVGELAAPIGRVVLDSSTGGIAALDDPPSLTRHLTLDPTTAKVIEQPLPPGARTPALWTWDATGAAWDGAFPMPDNFVYHAASQRFAYSDGYGLGVICFQDGWRRRDASPRQLSPPPVALGPDPRWLLIGGFLLDLRDRAGPELGRVVPLAGPLRFSADGHWLAGVQDKGLAIIELAGARRVHRSAHTKQADQLAVSADGTSVLVVEGTQLVHWRTDTGATTVVRTLPKQGWFGLGAGPKLRCAPDARHVFLESEAELVVFDLLDARELLTLPTDADHPAAWLTADSFATAWRSASHSHDLVIGEYSISDAFAPRARTYRLSRKASPKSLTVTPGGHLVVAQHAFFGGSSVVRVEPATGRTTVLPGTLLGIGPGDELWTRPSSVTLARATLDEVHVSPAAARLADTLTLVPAARWVLELDDRLLQLRSADTLELVATLLVTERYSSSGIWDFMIATAGGPFDGTMPGWRKVQMRFGEALDEIADPDQFFAEFYVPGLFAQLWRREPQRLPDLAAIDRRTPRVTLLQFHDAGVPPGCIGIELRVAEVPPDAAHPTGSGARDLRLYRYASRVAAWHGDLLGDASTATFRAIVPVDGPSCEVVAHAYNRANVKGVDMSGPMSPVEPVESAAAVQVLAIGIDRYPAHRPLACAVADAQAVASALEQAVAGHGPSLGRGDPPPSREVAITATLLDEQATKASILSALARLAGRADSELPASCRALRRSGPSDLVVVTFAGHGMRVGPRFYLLPHDTRREAGRTDPATAISDAELEAAFADIDAATIVLVIDACYSGAALDSDEPRSGFLNVRSLAQLAFDKHMIILAAAQSTEAALEQAELGQGLLTYALIREGLEAGLADRDPDDGVIRLGELLRYAAERVPLLEAERWGVAREVLDEDEAETDSLEAATQRPRVYLSSRELEDLVIARRRYDLASDAWFRRVEATMALVEAGTPPAFVFNAIVTEPTPIHLSIADDRITRGHRADPTPTLSLPLRLARAILIARDPAVAAAALVAGELVFTGDPQQLSAWLAAPPTPLAQRLAAITR